VIFAALGRFVDKYKYPVLLVWLALAIIFMLTAPSLSKVGVTDQSQFLPTATESVHVRDLLQNKFAHTDTFTSSALLVVFNKDSLSQEDKDRAQQVHDWLISDSAPPAVSGVTSVFDNSNLSSSLVSQDNTTMLMYVYFSVQPLDDAAKQAVVQIREQTARQQGTTFYLTGNVGLLGDLFTSVQNTISRTTYVTIILVIILLLLVYRSPIASLVPLIAIGMSYLIARGIVGFLAQAGVAVSTMTDAYLVVTMFGVGTDYCLFIISRFREELAQKDRRESINFTMRRMGPIILASATTVVIAFLCLSISSFGMTRTSGWALAIGIIITLAAGLTLVPALMSIFGKKLFWPSKELASRSSGKFGWGKIGQWVSARPLIFAIPLIVVLALPYIALPHMSLSANVLAQLPKKVESATGFAVIREHFPAGVLAPVTLLIQSPDKSLLDGNSPSEIETVAQSIGNINAVSRVEYFAAPASQIAGLGVQVKGIGDKLASSGQLDASSTALLQSLPAVLQGVAVQYPGVTGNPGFAGATTDLPQISTALTQLRSAPPADLPNLLNKAVTLLNSLSNDLNTLSSEFQLKGSSAFVGWLKAKYFSTDGTVTRMNLILKDDPYSDTTTGEIIQLRKDVAAIIDSSNLKGSSHYIGGDTAIHYDMLKTSDSDLMKVMILTVIGILAVIIILLRSLLAPLYMVLTVLFNYGATLGICTWLFLDVLNGENLMYLLPVFVFVMLVAVGADYNIFLVSRIREESEHGTMKEAIQRAVTHTGGVITSCGIILAGTFATLASSSLPMVLQIGAAIAIGVIIDTFLVRAILVPSLASLAGRWSWWPSKLSKKT
jgi:putative drug exporter of the RND superfamily